MSLESSCWKGTTSIPFGLYYHGFSWINYKLNLAKQKHISNFVYCLMLMHLLKFCLSCIYDVSYFGLLQCDSWPFPNIPCGTVDIARMCSKRKKKLLECDANAVASGRVAVVDPGSKMFLVVLLEQRLTLVDVHSPGSIIAIKV
jgi:hypothetical protein